MGKWEKCKTCAMDRRCENQDKNFECKYPYKFVSGRKFLEDVEYYKNVSRGVKIMETKRYTIVKCQRKCPYYEVISKKCLLDLEDCSKECINIKGKFQYGDTKEQMIKKVAQVIERRFARNYRFGILIDEIKKGLAEEIIEVLGVENAHK